MKNNNMDNYLVGPLIARGHYGRVYKCKLKNSNQTLAIKVIPIEKVRSHEIEILSKLKHDNIIKLVDSFSEGDNMFIITNYIDGKELFEHVDNLDYDKTIKYIKQLVDTLDYLHNQNIIHRDIKLENIILDNNDNIVLCDFGWATFCNKKQFDLAGTPDYVSPEVLDGKGHDHTYDIWQVGVLTYEMLIKKPPFTSPNMYTKIRRVDYKVPSDLCYKAENFISKLLVYNPSDRMTIYEIKKHIFLN